MPNLPLMGSALGYAAATAFGSFVSRRFDVPAEPLGIDVPIPVRRSLAVGLGGGTAIPWPMAVAALIASVNSGSDRSGPARLCAGLGVASLIGTLVEPVTWRRRAFSTPVAATVVANVSASVALISCGWRAITTSSGADQGEPLTAGGPSIVTDRT